MIRPMRRFSILTRLALASLAVLGFSAPLAAPESDRVTQTCGGKPREAPFLQPSRARRLSTAAYRRPAGAATPEAARRSVELARRYLMHRAWLL